MEYQYEIAFYQLGRINKVFVPYMEGKFAGFITVERLLDNKGSLKLGTFGFPDLFIFNYGCGKTIGSTSQT